MVEFVNCFQVPVGREDEFLALWTTVNAHMVTRPGYRSHRLLRSLRSDATYRFVNTARWGSVEAWQGAHDAEFRGLVSGPAWAGISSVPALYEPAHEGTRP